MGHGAPRRPRTRLLEVDAYNRWLLVQHRTEGMTGVTVFPLGLTGTAGNNHFPEPLYELSRVPTRTRRDRIRLIRVFEHPVRGYEYRMDTPSAVAARFPC